MNDTKCVLPWIHIAMRTNGSVVPCCFSKFRSKNLLNVFNHDFSEILNSSDLERIRSEMEKGEKPIECEVCYSGENRGIISKRLLENEKWKIDEVSKGIRFLDLRFNSNCNLKCVMCSLSESTSWREDTFFLLENAKNPYLKESILPHTLMTRNPGEDFTKLWKNIKLHLNDLEEIYFAGGEPLIQKEHDHCLELLKGHEDKIRLTYNTNGININDRTLEKWSNFKSVQINLSLDAFGEKNNYIRYPSDWSHLTNILSRLDNTDDNISVRITTTVQVLNVFYLKELINWKIESNFKKIQIQLAKGDVDINVLQWPKYMNVQALSPEGKLLAEKALLEITKMAHISENFKRRVKGLISYMHEIHIPEEYGINPLKEYLELLDRTRKTDAGEIFPILNELITS